MSLRSRSLSGCKLDLSDRYFSNPPCGTAECGRNGGARRSRTDDILLAKQALYQLSYGPKPWGELKGASSIRTAGEEDVVGLGRLELPTLRLSGVRSNHLSYRPMTAMRRNTPLGSRSTLTLNGSR